MTRERESYDWQSSTDSSIRSSDFAPTTGLDTRSGHRAPRRPPPRRSGMGWLIMTAALVLVAAVAAALLVPGLFHR
jgi:hypothetical protein